MTREQILEEIRRLAAENGGKAPGVRGFETETGYRWRDGVHWARWSDAVREAGLAPNEMTVAYDEEHLLGLVASLAAEIGRFPAKSDLKFRSNQDPGFPSADAIERRFRPRSVLAERVAAYSAERPDLVGVTEMCRDYLAKARPTAGSAEGGPGVDPDDQYVYLLKAGKHYKIGRSNSVGRREAELRIQLPEKATVVHRIRTDDATGIERYWHQRFEAVRLNGEWFELSADQVRAFKRRKFM